MRRVNQKIPSRLLHWPLPPKHFALSDDAVHVWVADLDEVSLTREFAPLLSQDEAERAARFHFQRDRRNFIAARGVLRTLLGNYAKTPAASLEFHYSATGKPSLNHAEKFGGLTFNLSHSDGVAVYAFSRQRELGIDVESLRPFADMQEIAARCFSTQQQSELQAAQRPEQELKFFRYWTRKEAVLKCGGEGFSDALCEIQDLAFDGELLDLEPAENFIATLAVKGNPFALKTWSFGTD